MAKYNITRLLETTPLLATQAGEQLKAAISYLAVLAENVSRCLRNGLSFADNFACEIRTVSLKHDVATPIGRRPGEALVTVYVSIGQAF